MEDLLYILAGVAYLAYSIYSAGQKQKKKQQQAVQKQSIQQLYAEPEVSEPVIKKEPVSSIFDEILGTQNFEFNIEEALYGKNDEGEILDVIPEKGEILDVVPKKGEILDVAPKEEGIRTTEVYSMVEKNEQTKEMVILLEEGSEVETLDYEFNLRDAVISSEILNPPYIKR